MFYQSKTFKELEKFFNTSYNYTSNILDNNNVEFEVPGFSKKDLSITIENNILSVIGDKSGRTVNNKLRLSDDHDSSKISASCLDGLLKITIPYKEQRKSKTIEIL